MECSAPETSEPDAGLSKYPAKQLERESKSKNCKQNAGEKQHCHNAVLVLMGQVLDKNAVVRAAAQVADGDIVFNTGVGRAG